MDNEKIAAMFQVAAVLISRYGFKEQLIREYAQFMQREMWFFNSNDEHYQLIRVTTNPASEFETDRERAETILKSFSLESGNDLSFLDIHIDNDAFAVKNEEYNHLNLYFDGYSDGTDVRSFYPELYSCVSRPADIAEEIRRCMDIINAAQSKRSKGEKALSSQICFVTYGVMAICTIVYLVSLFFRKNYSDSAVYIFLGADYQTFTLGLRQFWRLLSCGFVHGGLLHLITNMYSIFILGSFLERRLGKRNYIFALLISTVTASLTQGILSQNTVTVGISGGIYGLMVIFIMDLIQLKAVPFRSFIPLILINLMINMLDTTAWVAHLGGVVSGIVLYYFFFTEDRIGLGLLIATMLLSLMYKYATIKVISPLYGGTDMEVVRIFEDLGMRDYALSLIKRLANVYAQYGG